MKTTPTLARGLAVGLLALCAGGIQAQTAPSTNVTMYGLIDTSIEVINKVAGSGSLTRMPNVTGTFPSRLGFRGSEDLGGGLNAFFTLEMGFAPDSGSSAQGGRLSGRQSLVGLGGAWGRVSLGRQYTMLFWSMVDSDLMGPAVYGVGSLDPYVPNARADNAVVYRGKFGAFDLGAEYSLGRDTVNAGPSPAGTNCPGESGTDHAACRQWSAMAKYDVPTWGVAVSFDSQNGRTPANASDPIFGNLTSSSRKDDRLQLGGYVKLAETKIAAGLVRRDNDGTTTKPRSNLWYLAASYPVTPQLTLDATWATLRYSDIADNNASLFAARAVYGLSRRTAVYAQLGHIRNDRLFALTVSSGAAGGAPVAGSGQTGVDFGIRHSF